MHLFFLFDHNILFICLHFIYKSIFSNILQLSNNFCLILEKDAWDRQRTFKYSTSMDDKTYYHNDFVLSKRSYFGDGTINLLLEYYTKQHKK